MSGCVLRARGEGWHASAFLQAHPLPDAHARGDGLNVLVSDCDGDDLPGQADDAVAFLRRHADALRSLATASGVSCCLDFGVWRADALMQSIRLPAELVVRAGELGVGLEVSIYAASD